MRGIQLSTYVAVLMITLFGGMATLLIVNAAHSVEDNGVYAGIDPFAPLPDALSQPQPQP